MASAVRGEGLNELLRAFRKVEGDLAKDLRRELGEVGRIVAQEARARFEPIQPRSAASMRHRLRGGTTVVAEQRRGRTTGQRPKFGKLQMERALIPALASKRSEVERKLEQMIDRLADQGGF